VPTEPSPGYAAHVRTTRVIGVAVALLVYAALAASPPVASAAVQVLDRSFQSAAVNGTLHYEIALPPGYETSGERYPVVYFLHGLPAGAGAYQSTRGLASSLAAAGLAAIVVGAQGARYGDPDPEWRNWGPGRNWETATEGELVDWIDGHYRTLARRSARAIVGISGGGYGATLIALHHPARFQVIESWSGYFYATDEEGYPLDLGSPALNAYANAHAFAQRLKAEFARYPRTLFGFFIGTEDPYPGFVADSKLLSRELSAARVPHLFRLYTGGHDDAFWSRHQDEWLAAAVRRLDPAA